MPLEVIFSQNQTTYPNSKPHTFSTFFGEETERKNAIDRSLTLTLNLNDKIFNHKH